MTEKTVELVGEVSDNTVALHFAGARTLPEPGYRLTVA